MLFGVKKKDKCYVVHISTDAFRCMSYVVICQQTLFKISLTDAFRCQKKDKCYVVHTSTDTFRSPFFFFLEEKRSKVHKIDSNKYVKNLIQFLLLVV